MFLTIVSFGEQIDSHGQWYGSTSRRREVKSQGRIRSRAAPLPQTMGAWIPNA